MTPDYLNEEPPQTARLVVASDLKPGMVMVLPFKRTATITDVKVGRDYVTLRLRDLPKTRIGKYEEVFVETA